MTHSATQAVAAKRIAARLIAAVLTAAAAALPAAGAEFPETGKTLKIIVPFAAGGGVDGAARLLGEQLRKQTGAVVVVDNRAGANGTIGGKAVELAPADGTTLLFSAATHVLARQVMSSPPYDPQTAFAPVARVGEAPLLLVVGPQSKVRSLGELMTQARQLPARTAAIPAAGAPSHLATLLWARQSGAKLDYVPYKGTQPALTDVAGGHVDLLLDSMISLLPLVKADKVHALAITSTQRSALAPEVPTMREAGLPKYAYASWYGVWAPKGTPPERVAALNAAINRAVAELAQAGAWAKLGIEPVSETPEQFRRFIAADVTQGAELLRSAGFTPE